MSGLDGKYAFREELSQRMIDDLIGPTDGPDEVLDDPPITRYVAGMLYPAGGGWRSAGTADSAEDVDESEGYDEAVTPDPAVAMANVRNPASMGLSFAVDATVCNRIRVAVQAARYVPLPAENDREESRWQRVPLSLEPVIIDVSTPQPGARQTLSEDLSLFIRVRPVDSRNVIAITTVLINESIAIATFPGEPFVKFQIDWKRQPDIPHPFLFGCTYSCGGEWPGYVADVRSAALGGYGADSSEEALEFGAGKAIMNRHLEHFYRLKGIVRDSPGPP